MLSRRPVATLLSAAIALSLATLNNPSSAFATLSRSNDTVLRGGASKPGTTTLTVSNCNDNGDGSLRAAVEAAASGDTIDLSGLNCSVITLTTGAIDVPIDTLDIQGRTEPALTVDANLADRAFSHSGTGTLTLTDLKIVRGRITSSEDGVGVSGGCIDSKGTVALDHVAISDCQVSSMAAATGGGVAASAVAISDSSIENCVALIPSPTVGNAFGGAVFSQGNAEVVRSTLSGNSAIGLHGYAWGGALLSLSGSTTITNSNLTSNLTQGYPYRPTAGSFAQLQAMGGAVAIVAAYSTTLDISGSTLSGNSSSSGGAIAIESFAPNTLQITNSTISGNEATSMGGGVWQVYGALTLSNSTIAFNSAVYGGGGIMPRHDLFTGVYYYAPVLQSTIVSNNTSNYYNADIFTRMTQLPVTGAHNLIIDTNLQLPEDTIQVDPQLLPLADNGGPTWTHELSDGSVAIDAGDNPLSLVFDQRGDGFPRAQGTAVDIGALEHSTISDTVFQNGFD